MLRLYIAAHLLLLAQAANFISVCKSSNVLIATSADCPPDDACDASAIKVDECGAITCSRGQVKFIDQTGQWSVAQERVTYNAALGVFMKSAGGASKTMDRVTCVFEPAKCAPLALFDGTEEFLSAYQSYQFIATAMSIRHGKRELVCPAGAAIGYATETDANFIYDTTMVVTCEAQGWWMTTDANENGVAISRIKVGCFKRVFVPTSNCGVVTFITESMLTPWVGVSVHNEDTYVESINGINMFKCSEDSLFAYIQGGSVKRVEWWMTCNNAHRAHWRVNDAGGKNGVYGLVPVGCLRPTWKLLQFDDSDAFILSKYSTHELVPTRPSLITNGKFTFTCARGSTLGYATSYKTITFDASAKVTCENDGWWMRTSADLRGRLISFTRVGCFRLMQQ